MEKITLSESEFNKLADYSCTLPTGTTLGKRWKCKKTYHDASQGWLMGEYVPHPQNKPNKVGIRWTEIEVI